MNSFEQSLLSRAMSVVPSPADYEPGAGGLVEMEHELPRLLLEYDELETAWPKCGHVLVRAKAGRLAADALLRIAGLQHAIATTPARTLPEAAVQLRRLAALYEGCSNPLRRLLQPDDVDDGRAARDLLASALAAVEAAESAEMGEPNGQG